MNSLIVRYIISGALAAATNLSITALLATYTKMHYLIVVSIAFAVSVGVSFSLQKLFTFREKGISSAPKQFASFIIVASANLAVNDLLVYFFVMVTGTRLLVLDQAIASLIIACYSFFLYRYGIFRQPITDES